MPSEAVALQNLIERHIPARAGLRLRASAVADRADALFPEELDAVTRAAPKRRAEFSTGRWLARELMAELGVAAAPIPQGAGREPVWPGEVLGTITHAGDTVVAAVAQCGAARSVGLDLEAWERVGERVHGKLFTAWERERLATWPPEAAGLLFSAKEAGYKATFPLARRYIGFHDAEVDVDWVAREFRFRYVGAHEPSSVMEAGAGHFLISGRYVLSLFIIP